ncbi:hypothetical protein X961_4345 [Burkholderia pseudomallei MSHR5613]|nr:hypothetical protein X961_4345 [Burkholderia pseudomallei MSHR5613]
MTVRRARLRRRLAWPGGGILLASHRTAPHRTAPHRTAPHRTRRGADASPRSAIYHLPSRRFPVSPAYLRAPRGGALTSAMPASTSAAAATKRGPIASPSSSTPKLTPKSGARNVNTESRAAL